MARYQLVGGQHQTTVPLYDKEGKSLGETVKTFFRGDVIETDEPLDTMYVNKFRVVQDMGRVANGLDLTPEEIELIQQRRLTGPLPEPTTLIPPAHTVQPERDLSIPARPPYVNPNEKPPQSQAEFDAQLQRMNVQQLKEMAAADEIDLKGAKTKDEMVKAIKAAY